MLLAHHEFDPGVPLAMLGFLVTAGLLVVALLRRRQEDQS